MEIINALRSSLAGRRVERQEVIKRHLAAGRRHKEQERLEFNRLEEDRRAIRWEKLHRVLEAAKLA